MVRFWKVFDGISKGFWEDFRRIFPRQTDRIAQTEATLLRAGTRRATEPKHRPHQINLDSNESASVTSDSAAPSRIACSRQQGCEKKHCCSPQPQKKATEARTGAVAENLEHDSSPRSRWPAQGCQQPHRGRRDDQHHAQATTAHDRGRPEPCASNTDEKEGPDGSRWDPRSVWRRNRCCFSDPLGARIAHEGRWFD